MNIKYDHTQHVFRSNYKGVRISFSAEEIYGTLDRNVKPEDVAMYYYTNIHADMVPLFCEIEEC